MIFLKKNNNVSEHKLFIINLKYNLYVKIFIITYCIYLEIIIYYKL